MSILKHYLENQDKRFSKIKKYNKNKKKRFNKKHKNCLKEFGIIKTNKVKYTKKTYADYLKTHHWKVTRIRFWKKYPRICLCCGNEAKELHHCNYSRLGFEKEEDLVPLCRNCHEEVHCLILNNKQVKLKNAHKVYKALLELNG